VVFYIFQANKENMEKKNKVYGKKHIQMDWAHTYLRTVLFSIFYRLEDRYFLKTLVCNFSLICPLVVTEVALGSQLSLKSRAVKNQRNSFRILDMRPQKCWLTSIVSGTFNCVRRIPNIYGLGRKTVLNKEPENYAFNISKYRDN
jgi:hypothetical protein